MEGYHVIRIQNETRAAGFPSNRGGTIRFFANGQSTNTIPLIRIDFDSATVTPLGIGAINTFYFDNGVVITGSETPGSLTNESFSFSFTNHEPLGSVSGDWSRGYTATASCTASAAPEPMTASLLLLGGTGFLLKYRRK